MENPITIAGASPAEPKKTMPFLPGSSAGIAPYTGPWDTAQVVHLLKRTLFGASVQDIAYFKNLTMSQAVDELLMPTSAPATAPLNNYGSDPTGVTPWQTWINTGLLYSDPDMNANRLSSLQAWWVGQLLGQTRSIHEKMTLFWHNHFAMDATVHLEDIPARLWYDQYITLRQHALGDFRQLVRSIVLDPAMLIYLNGNTNTKKAPNENFARELQELYTIGKGPGSQYTENDVHAAARALTGHTLDNNYSYVFQSGDHDDTNKSFSNFYASHIITGYSGPAGANEIDDLLGMIFASEESAKFICRKLYGFFVYYKIDAATETNVITPLANILRQNNYNITPVLSALLKSQHFHDLVYSGACIIKSPLDLLIGLVREFKVAIPTAADPQKQYAAWEMLQDRARILQQQIMGIELVAGWDAYRQAPQFHELWINSVTYSGRNFYTDTLIGTGDMMMGTTLKIDVIAFASMLPAPDKADQLISDSLDILLRTPLSDNAKELLKRSILLTGQADDNYWTKAWLAYTVNPADMNAFTAVDNRLRALYKYIMDLPEYQLS